jgi:hypothetical protein
LKSPLALPVLLTAFCFSTGGAEAATLTVCNTSDTAATGIYFEPPWQGYGSGATRKLALGQCLPLAGIPDGQYNIDIVYAPYDIDCVRPLTVSGDTKYTFDQATKDACAVEFLEQKD